MCLLARGSGLSKRSLASAARFLAVTPTPGSGGEATINTLDAKCHAATVSVCHIKKQKQGQFLQCNRNTGGDTHDNGYDNMSCDALGKMTPVF